MATIRRAYQTKGNVGSSGTITFPINSEGDWVTVLYLITYNYDPRPFTFPTEGWENIIDPDDHYASVTLGYRTVFAWKRTGDGVMEEVSIPYTAGLNGFTYGLIALAWELGELESIGEWFFANRSQVMEGDLASFQGNSPGDGELWSVAARVTDSFAPV